MVVTINTNLNPLDFLNLIFSIEKKLGRIRGKKNDPRTCDLDIIDFNSEIIEFDSNNINFSSPHKKLINRNFVLYPLKEILPLWKHPVTNESIDILISKLPSEDKKSILKIKNLI